MGLQNPVDGSVTRTRLHEITSIYSKLFLIQYIHEFRKRWLEEVIAVGENMRNSVGYIALELGEFRKRRHRVVFAMEQMNLFGAGFQPFR
jgi:hypothetical protein